MPTDEPWRMDNEYEDHEITSVKKEDGGWTITTDEGFSLYVKRTPENKKFVPKKGMNARYFGRGIGFPVRGIMLLYTSGEIAKVAKAQKSTKSLNLPARILYYRTDAEEEQRSRDWVRDDEKEKREEFEREKDDYFRRISALPAEFQRRFERFRKNNPEFDWKFGDYELFCCEEATRIAKHLGSKEAFEKAREEYRATKPEHPSGTAFLERVGFVLDDNHSGNTAGSALDLAKCYLVKPHLLPFMHGSIAVLVGCEKLGCPPPTEAEIAAAEIGAAGATP